MASYCKVVIYVYYTDQSVSDVEAALMIDQRLARLFLAPVSRSVQRRPTVQVLCVHTRARLQEDAAKEKQTSIHIQHEVEKSE